MAKIFYKDLINARIEAAPIPQESRGYLGLSQVGHECARSVYYALHNAPRKPVHPRTIRIWAQGDWQEGQIIADLERIGCKVWGQQEEISLLGGMVQGHIDGRIIGVPGAKKTEHLLELKSMADTYFKKYAKEGIKKSHEPYWVQAQLYAKYLGLDWILFAVVNKNTEERRFERIPAEPEKVEVYVDRMHEIIAVEEPPDKVGGPDWWLCKFFCSYTEHCHDL